MAHAPLIPAGQLLECPALTPVSLCRAVGGVWQGEQLLPNFQLKQGCSALEDGKSLCLPSTLLCRSCVGMGSPSPWGQCRAPTRALCASREGDGTKCAVPALPAPGTAVPRQAVLPAPLPAPHTMS